MQSLIREMRKTFNYASDRAHWRYIFLNVDKDHHYLTLTELASRLEETQDDMGRLYSLSECFKDLTGSRENHPNCDKAFGYDRWNVHLLEDEMLLRTDFFNRTQQDEFLEGELN